MKLFMNHHPWSTDWDARTQRGTRSSAPPHLNISVFLHMQSNRFVDGTDDCEMVGQRAQQPRITSLSLSDDKRWCTWLLKGNGRRLSDCFDISSTQKHTHTTALHRTLHPDYPPFNSHHGLEHTCSALYCMFYRSSIGPISYGGQICLCIKKVLWLTNYTIVYILGWSTLRMLSRPFLLNAVPTCPPPFKLCFFNPNSINHPPVFTFHWSTSVFLVPLAFLGGLGGSGSQLKVVKLTDSDGLPCKQLHMAWTLKWEEQSVYKMFLRARTLLVQTKECEALR